MTQFQTTNDAIFIGEQALLLAVRNCLRKPASLFGAEMLDKECQIEYDATAQATAGDKYVCVTPGGFYPGPNHASCGTINDIVYAIDVEVIKRTTHIAPDRQREKFIQDPYAVKMDTLSLEMDKVYSAVDWSRYVLQEANNILAEFYNSEEVFIEPLIFTSVEKKPSAAGSEYFANNEKKSGIRRQISFGGARRITIKNMQ